MSSSDAPTVDRVALERHRANPRAMPRAKTSRSCCCPSALIFRGALVMRRCHSNARPCSCFPSMAKPPWSCRDLKPPESLMTSVSFALRRLERDRERRRHRRRARRFENTTSGVGSFLGELADRLYNKLCQRELHSAASRVTSPLRSVKDDLEIASLRRQARR